MGNPLTIVGNGPMEVFEMKPFAALTFAIAHMLADVSESIINAPSPSAFATHPAHVKFL